MCMCVCVYVYICIYVYMYIYIYIYIYIYMGAMCEMVVQKRASKRNPPLHMRHTSAAHSASALLSHFGATCLSTWDKITASPKIQMNQGFGITCMVAARCKMVSESIWKQMKCVQR